MWRRSPRWRGRCYELARRRRRGRTTIGLVGEGAGVQVVDQTPVTFCDTGEIRHNAPRHTGNQDISST